MTTFTGATLSVPARLTPGRAAKRIAAGAVRKRRHAMILATSKIEDFDRFWQTFSTKGAAKRKEHGSKGAHVFRDPHDEQRIWAVFDWDDESFQQFVSDPEAREIFREGGLQGPPQAAESAGETDT
jgi:quinol monooxygenase YgiN